MGKLTHTVSGSIASFKSPDKSPIESLKVHFAPTQEGTGDPSPTNVRAINGWTGFNSYVASKNIGHVVGYSAESVTDSTTTRKTSNSYGTTISTTNYEGTTGELVITQSEWPNSTLSSYKNGYVTVVLDNMVFDKQYDISFKVTSILNNPLEAELANLRLNDPSGNNYYSPVEIVNSNIVIFKNVTFAQNTSKPNDMSFDVRICGMSFTLSEFMVTPAYQNDCIFEPYKGSTIPVTVPAGGKNLLKTTEYAGQFFNVETGTDLKGSTSRATFSENGNVITITTTHEWYGCIFATDLLHPGTYTIHSELSDSDVRRSAYVTDSNLITKERYSLVNDDRTITLTESSRIVVTISIQAVGTGTATNLQVECGLAYTTYEPRNSVTTYGGYVDLITGDVVAEWCSHTFDGSEQIKISTTFTGTGGERYDTNAMDFAKPQDSMAISDKAKTLTSNPSTVTELSLRSGSGAWRTMFFVPDDLFEGENNADNFKQWLSENNVTICEHYETPVTIAFLTPTELRAFIGANNIRSNANGNVECMYELKDHLLKKRRTFMRDHKVTTTPTPVANFKSGIKGGILDSCIVDFSPVQTGSGDPSPTNVRPISGWRGFNINQNGSNLLNPSLWPSPINGHYIKCETGANLFWSPGAYNASDFVPIKGGAQYTLHASFTGQNSGDNKSGIAFYTTNDSSSYISGIHMDITLGTIYTFTTPENAKYMRFCNHIECVPNDEVWLVAGSVLGTQETYVGSTTAITLPDIPMGKNLLNPAFKGFSDTLDVQTWGRDSSTNLPNGDLILPAGNYTLSITGCPVEARPTEWKVVDEDSNVLFHSYSMSNMYGTFTLLSEKAIFVLMSVPGTDNEYKTASHYALHNQVMLERGSTATAFEPYTSEIPGGYVDIIKGTIVQTHKRVNLGDYTWDKISQLSSNVHNKYFYVAAGGLTSSNTRFDTPTDSYCSAFPFIARHDMYMVDNTRGIAFDNGAMYVSWADMDDYTVSEFKEAVAGYYLVAPLVEPIEYQLTSVQLKTLLGTNNIWADTNGNTTVTYWTR